VSIGPDFLHQDSTGHGRESNHAKHQGLRIMQIYGFVGLCGIQYPKNERKIENVTLKVISLKKLENRKDEIFSACFFPKTLFH
jgi:hypothetical protein